MHEKKYKCAYIWIRQAHYKVREKIIDPSEKWIAYKHKFAKKSRSYNYFLFLLFLGSNIYTDRVCIYNEKESLMIQRRFSELKRKILDLFHCCKSSKWF